LYAALKRCLTPQNCLRPYIYVHKKSHFKTSKRFKAATISIGNTNANARI
jgi:hypothetical protein